MPLLNHHEASLSFPPPKLDASSSSSHLFPLSPLIFDHDLFNDITLILAPPPQITPSSPPPPPLRPSPPDKPSSTHRNTNPSPRSAAALMCDLDKYCGTTRPAKSVDGGGAVGRRLIRKDRHSKIHTAQGPRDRRMRLSLDVARKFFDLQDTLGFDKASKTVDWLLSCCKSSIMELTGSSSARRRHPAAVLDAVGNAKSESSTSSECEVISVSTDHAPPAARAKRAAVRRCPRHAPAAHSPPSREKRQMARARARERTKKNKMLRSRQCEGGGGGQRSKQPPASSTGEDSAGTGGTHTTTTSCRDLLIAEEGQLITTCSLDQCKSCPGAASQPAVAIAGGSSASISILDYSQNIVRHGDDISFVEKHHSWDMIPPTGSAEEQRVLSFADHSQLQLFLWEAFQLIPSP